MTDAPDPRDRRRPRTNRSTPASTTADTGRVADGVAGAGTGPGTGAGRRGDDPAEAYLAAYLDAAERGEEPPDLDDLDAAAQADVQAVLALLAGDGAAEAGSGVGGGARAGDLRPLGESEFAVEHGLSRTNPDVVVSGPAVRRARGVAGMTTIDVADEMARRGTAIDPATLDALEARTAHRMHPREARLLAAVLDLPLDTIEAGAEPWPADPESLADLAGATDTATTRTTLRPTEPSGTDTPGPGGTGTPGSGDTGPGPGTGTLGTDTPGTGTGDATRTAVTPIVLGEDVVLRTGTGSHLGVLRCDGGADVLDSRTYREAAATRLNGRWSHLAGALLVSRETPHLALAVDALDCVARQHAPSGLTGFTRLAEPEWIGEALASYDRAYAISWTDPDPLEGLATRPDQAARSLAGRIAALAERLADEARRSRQPGKRPGYAAAAKWFGTTPPADVAALLDELAHADPDEARRRLAELTEVVLA